MPAMLVHVQKIKLDKNAEDEFLFSTQAKGGTGEQVHVLSKRSLCSAVQMLHTNESTTLLSNEHCSLTLTNTGANYFLATCSSNGVSSSARVTPFTITSTRYSDSNTDSQRTSFDSLLRYLRQQLLPIYSECLLVSSDMQDIFGFIPYTETSIAYRSKRTDDTFVIDNATSISKLTDMLNVDLHDRLGAYVRRRGASQRNTVAQKINAPEQAQQPAQYTTTVFSAAYAARQLQLAAIFCATASQNRACMWHVGQGMMSDMTSDIQTCLYDSIEPEKHHITLLMKGDNTSERIFRINLAVRMFPPEHPFSQKSMPTAMAMNSSPPRAGVMVVTGVHNNIAAVIYDNSDSQTVQQQKLALAAYMGV
jgi:hypothetical protein